MSVCINIDGRLDFRARRIQEFDKEYAAATKSVSHVYTRTIVQLKTKCYCSFGLGDYAILCFVHRESHRQQKYVF